jgi:site-specific DNA recombinase
MAGVLPLAEYKRRRQDLDQRLESLDNQARQIEANVHQQMELASLTSSITAFCQRVNRGLLEATFEQKRQLVELLIDRVVVTMEEVEIRYVVPTSPQSEQIRFCHLLTDYSVAKSFTWGVLTRQAELRLGVIGLAFPVLQWECR